MRQSAAVKLAIAKDIGSDDHLCCTPAEPSRRIVGTNAAADLQAPREGGEGLRGRVLVARAEHDDVAAGELVATIARRKVRRRMGGDEVGLGGRAVAQAGADDLLDSPLVQVNTGPEAHQRSQRYSATASSSRLTPRPGPAGGRMYPSAMGSFSRMTSPR